MNTEIHVTAFGDSIMKGVVPDPIRSRRFVVLQENFLMQCMRRLGIKADNFGKFGSTVPEGMQILDRHLPQLNASTYTLLEYGGNDSDYDWRQIASDPSLPHTPKTPLSSFSRIYTEMIQKVRASGSHPVLLSLPPLDPGRYFRYFTKGMDRQSKDNIMTWLGRTLDTIRHGHELYNLEIFKLAASLRVQMVDITSAFMAHRNYRTLLSEDGIHPNERGHALIAETLCRFFATAVIV